MLVLTRKVGEKIVIGKPEDPAIVIVILEVQGNKVRIGIEAPVSVPIVKS